VSKLQVKGKLNQQDYFLYDSLCSIMDKDKRKESLQVCRALDLKPNFFMVGCDEVALLEGEDSIVISVSGSDKDKEEWRGNFNAYRGIIDIFKKTPKTKKGFHYNFYLQARHLKRIVKSFLKANPRIKTVIFDGHSRGGAIVRVCYMLMNCEIHLVDMMVTPFDPPKSFTRRGWSWYNRNRKRKDISHRTKSFMSIVGAVPPFILGWVHRDTTLLKLPNVRGKFNHTAITEGLKRKFGVE
jgi:hypothetical protein